MCSGLELSDTRFNNAILLNDKDNLHLFQANICDPSSYKNHIKQNYDLIIIRDVIEHISNKETALLICLVFLNLVGNYLFLIHQNIVHMLGISRQSQMFLERSHIFIYYLIFI